MDIYTPIALKLHAFGLQRLQDPNWTGMELFDALKRPVRREGFLTTYQKNGFLYWLGEMLFRDYLVDQHYVEELRGEYFVWCVEDYATFLKHHGADHGRKSLAWLDNLVMRSDELFEADEKKYFRLVESKRIHQKAIDVLGRVRRKNTELLKRLAPFYAANYADRVFHDRQLCHYLSQLIVSIGFDGMNSSDDTHPKQWMERIALPVWVKELVVARDRGHCAQCKADITLELEADDHFDHMIPLSRGGCNDLVNLQLLCDKCNLGKSNKDVLIHSSIPPYLHRYHRGKRG